MISREKKYIIIISILTIILTFIPHLVGLYRLNNDNFKSYQAYNLFALSDTNVYYSYINQAKEGKILFENLFTSEEQKPSMFHPLWLSAGFFAFVTKLSTPLVYQLFRLLACIFFFFVVYRFLTFLNLSPKQRIIAFLFIALSSGFGLFFIRFNNPSFNQIYYPSDLRIGESNTFDSLYHSPLFPLAQSLIILCFYFFLRALKNNKNKYLLYCGLTIFILSFIHTYDLITVAVIIIAYGLVLMLSDQFKNPREFLSFLKKGLFLIIFVFPVIIQYFLVLRRERAITGWLQQNITLSPAIWSYLLGYGLIIILALIGSAYVIKRGLKHLYFLFVWIICGLVLIYFPHLQIQRRLSNGLHIPLSIVAALGFLWIYKKINKGGHLWRLIITVIILIIFLFSAPLAVITHDGLYIWHQKESDLYSYFIKGDEMESYNFLKNAAGNNKIIYSHPWIGNILAGQGRLVFLGHGHQTVNWEKKRGLLDQFYNNFNEQEREKYLKENNISFLYFGPMEKTLGSWRPTENSFLKLVFRKGDVQIFKLIYN